MSASIELPSVYELHYPGDLELIPVVRRFLFDLCNKAVPKAPELASNVALATYELLDNAARHGTRREAVLRFEILALEPTPQVRVSVANTVTLAQLQVLSAEVEKVRLAADPEAHFHELQRALTTGHVGLGLARIRADARLDVHLGVLGSKATVFAQSPELLGSTTSRPPSRTALASPMDATRPPTHGMLMPVRPTPKTDPSLVVPDPLLNPPKK